MTISPYKTEMCEQLIQYGEEGLTKVEVASKWNITRETIYEWERVHPEFAEAVEKYEEKLKAWIHKKIRDGLMDNGTIRLNGHALNTYLWLVLRESVNSIHSANIKLPPQFSDPKISLDDKQRIIDEALSNKKITGAQYEILLKSLQAQADRKEAIEIKRLLAEAKEKMKELTKQR